MSNTIFALVRSVAVHSIKTFFVFKEILEWSPEKDTEQYLQHTMGKSILEVHEVNSFGIYSPYGKYSDPLTLPHFITLQLYSKIYSIVFPHQSTHNTPL
jgi:hypothetical protein